VDSALLGHPLVAEAVSFGAPSEKYGEIVAAAVVLSSAPKQDAAAVAADIQKFAATKLAKFKARACYAALILG
jgi:acyl-coenzyme A synthetase/AMP-(fatty) acid ligase